MLGTAPSVKLIILILIECLTLAETAKACVNFICFIIEAKKHIIDKQPENKIKLNATSKKTWLT